MNRRPIRELGFRMRLNGDERAWLETIAERSDLTLSAAVRRLVKRAYDAALVGERERIGLDENELTVIDILARQAAMDSRTGIEYSFWRRIPAFSPKPQLKREMKRLAYLGYLKRHGAKYTLTAKGVAAAQMHAGCLPMKPIGVECCGTSPAPVPVSALQVVAPVVGYVEPPGT